MPEIEEGGAFSEGAPASPEQAVSGAQRPDPDVPELPSPERWAQERQAEPDHERFAQGWHDEQPPEHHEERGGYASCWCCCTACDPDYVGEPHTPNPFWQQAQESLRFWSSGQP